MKITTIHIRNMCCQRCVEAVTDELQTLGLKLKSVKLGKATYAESKRFSTGVIAERLKKRGFELIKSKDDEIAEKIKIAIHKIFTEFIADDLSNFHLPKYLEKQVNLPYRKLTEIFTTLNKKTIERYFISYKIETVKALIDDSDKSFTEIAFKLGYKSLSHLSKQFKLLEGISMHDYKLKHQISRKFIDKL